MDQKVLDRALKLFIRLIHYSEELEELLQKELLEDQYLDSLFMSFFDRSESRLPRESSLLGKVGIDDAHTLQRFASKVFEMMMGYRQVLFNFKVLKHDFLIAFYSKLHQYVNPRNHSRFLRVVLLLIDRYLAYLRLATDYVQQNRQSPLFRAQALTQQRLQFETLIAQNFREICLKQNLLPLAQQSNEMNLSRAQARKKTINQIIFQVCRTCGQSFQQQQIFIHMSKCKVRKRTLKKSFVRKQSVALLDPGKQKPTRNKPFFKKFNSFKSFKSLRFVAKLQDKQTCKVKAKSSYQIPLKPTRHYLPFKPMSSGKKKQKSTNSEPKGAWIRSSQFEPEEGGRLHRNQRDQVAWFFVNKWLYQ